MRGSGAVLVAAGRIYDGRQTFTGNKGGEGGGASGNYLGHTLKYCSRYRSRRARVYGGHARAYIAHGR